MGVILVSTSRLLCWESVGTVCAYGGHLMLIRGLLRSVPGESLEQPGLGPVSGWHTAQQQSPDVCVVPTERPFLSCAEFPVHTLLCPSLSSSSSCPSGVTGSGGGAGGYSSVPVSQQIRH